MYICVECAKAQDAWDEVFKMWAQQGKAFAEDEAMPSSQAECVLCHKQALCIDAKSITIGFPYNANNFTTEERREVEARIKRDMKARKAKDAQYELEFMMEKNKKAERDLELIVLIQELDMDADDDQDDVADAFSPYQVSLVVYMAVKFIGKNK